MTTKKRREKYEFRIVYSSTTLTLDDARTVRVHKTISSGNKTFGRTHRKRERERDSIIVLRIRNGDSEMCSGLTPCEFQHSQRKKHLADVCIRIQKHYSRP